LDAARVSRFTSRTVVTPPEVLLYRKVPACVAGLKMVLVRLFCTGKE
jgi:hypothetical protein